MELAQKLGVYAVYNTLPPRHLWCLDPLAFGVWLWPSCLLILYLPLVFTAQLQAQRL